MPKDLDLETQLKAGTLLYYREGAAATVSVKRLTGTTTLAVDGKTDASNRGDMLTQKLIAHLPLAAARQPAHGGHRRSGQRRHSRRGTPTPDLPCGCDRDVAAKWWKRHAISRKRTSDALQDPRTHLIVGDGRSHLLLSNQRYDVIVSEPSNPWIAGVSALFTREFFQTVREHLEPGGIDLPVGQHLQHQRR